MNAPLEPLPSTNTPRWRWYLHLLLIGGFFLPGIAFSAFHPRQGAALTSSARGLLLVTAENLGMFALLFALGWWISRARRDEMFLRWRPGWLVVPLGAAYSIAIRVALAIVAVATVMFLLVTRIVTQQSLQNLRAMKIVDVEKLVDKSAMQHQPLYFWLSVTLVSFVIGGLREELWRGGTLAALRALWPRMFATRFGEIVAVVLIAIVFGAAHFPLGWIAALAAAFLGVLLGFITLFHRSIWPAVFAHGFFDALSLAVLPYVLDKLQHLS